MAAAATAVPFEMPRLDDGDDGGDGGFDIGPVTSVADDVVGSDGAAAAAPAAAAAGDSVVAAAVAAADTLNHIIAAAAAANKTAAAAAAAAAGAAGAGDNAKAATSTGPSPGFVSRSLWKVTSPAEWLPGQVEISYSNCSALANSESSRGWEGCIEGAGGKESALRTGAVCRVVAAARRQPRCRRVSF